MDTLYHLLVTYVVGSLLPFSFGSKGSEPVKSMALNFSVTSKYVRALYREKISYSIFMEDENINFTGLYADDNDGIPLSVFYLSQFSTLRYSSRVTLVHSHGRDTNLFKPN